MVGVGFMGNFFADGWEGKTFPWHLHRRPHWGFVLPPQSPNVGSSLLGQQEGQLQGQSDFIPESVVSGVGGGGRGLLRT